MAHHSITTLVLLLTTFLVSLGLCEEELLTSENGCRVLIDAYDRSAMYSRNFIGGQSNKWPNGEIPYTISDDFSYRQRQVILEAMAHISDKTCVKFIPKTTHENYVDIYTGGRGCFANMGYHKGRRRTVVHLQNGGCVIPGIVIHELLHTLGFAHEHTRPDRDDYVKIHWGNMQSGTQSNFWRALGENEQENIPFCGSVNIHQYDRCHSGFRVSTFGKPYDYGSVMHYGFTFFTKNGQKTLTLKKSTNVRVPNRLEMSRLDVEKTRIAYQCDRDSSARKNPKTTTKKIATRKITTEEAATEETTTLKITTEEAATEKTTALKITTRKPTNGSCTDTWDECYKYKRHCGQHPFIKRHCKKTCNNCDCKNQIADESCHVLGDYCGFPFIQKFCARECKTC